MANNKNITFNQLEASMTKVKAAIDKKANTSHGNHVPKTETANNARFLRNDNTWQTITPVNIGAADRSHNHTFLTGVTSLQFAAASSDHATIKVTTDGGSAANTYLDFEMDDDTGSDMFRWRFNAWDSSASASTGQFNLMTLSAKDTTSARLTVNGDVTASSFTGNASSATKLQTARAIKIGNTSRNFDGNANVTWTLADIGAAPSSHGTHVTWSTTTPKANGTAAVGTETKVARGDHVHPLQTNVSGSSGSCTGNAATATKLKTARNIALTGTITGNANFDGSGNISIATSVNSVPASGSWFKGIPTVTSAGVMEIGKYIDFHNAADGTTDYDVRLQCNGTSANTVNMPTKSGTLALLSDNVTSATRLQTARKIGKASFNGTANIALSDIMGRATTSTSGSDNKNKYTKFARIDISSSAYTNCCGKLSIASFESNRVQGILDYYFRTNDTISSVTIGLYWTSLSASGYENTIYAVKVSNGVYDLYYKPLGDWDTTKITNIDCTDSDKITFYSNQSFVSSITAVATSSLYSYSSACLGNANTATTLKTARTINGTSFNGSANITTANWGTARTLTIGNTGKSVNGGGNVSWSIDEIGALKASKQGATDVNTLKTTGRYFIKGTPTNAPTTNNGVIDVAWDLGTPYQIFYPDNANTAYKRNWNNSNSTWSSWTQLKFTDTNTWRGVQNNLTSDATDQSLSAAQGKVLKGLVDGKAASNHTHNNIVSRGSVTAESGTTRPAVGGLSMTQAYNNGYPFSYGNVLSMKGQGDGELFIGWSGTSGEQAPVYVRSKRDTGDANWSEWAQIYTSSLTTKTVSNGTLTLGTEFHQYAAISSAATIKLPSVSSFTEIHLFFNWPANVSVTMPSGVKWQQGVMYGPGHVHEFVFTYVNNIGWLGGCVVYG